jgi:hypothetical protein
MRMIRSRITRRAIAIGAAAILGWMSAISLAEAGSSLTSRSFATGPILTNPGARYSLDYGTQLHTNPGGKYVYRGQASKFHTNPGGKYVYPGYTAAPH